MEDIDPAENHGCSKKLRWWQKANKTDQAGCKVEAKTFLKDDVEGALSLAAAIWHMEQLKGRPKKEDEERTPAFAGTDGKEIFLAKSKRMLKKKVQEAGLGEEFIKGHSLRIW